jgi:cytochrome c-type biogenesis protein CcmF
VNRIAEESGSCLGVKPGRVRQSLCILSVQWRSCFALLIGLALAAYNLLAGGVALRLLAVAGVGTRPARVSPERLAETARRAGMAGFVAITAAAFALIWSVFHNDFSIEYIVEHSNIALPTPYKFAALWSGQEGSLLLWAWLLAAY